MSIMSGRRSDITTRTSESESSQPFYSRRKGFSMQLHKLLLVENEQKRNNHLPPLENHPNHHLGLENSTVPQTFDHLKGLAPRPLDHLKGLAPRPLDHLKDHVPRPLDHLKDHVPRPLDHPSNGVNYSRDVVDMKIISHLRRHISKRKLYQMEKARTRRKKMDMSRRGCTVEREPSMHEPAVGAIFSKYSDTGEKVQRGLNCNSLGGSNSRFSAPSSSFDFPRSDEVDGSSGTQHFPPITNTRSPTVSTSQENDKKIPTEAANKLPRSSELPALTTAGDINQRTSKATSSDTKDALTAKLIASSVHDLPDLSDSSERNHESPSVMMEQVLNGDVHGRCPADKNVIYLYIASGNADMEAELSFLQEHLYPQLRSHFRRQGHELRILDLHWGFKDTVSDDHMILRVLQRAITKARDTKLGINFVFLIGQKYGPKLLPSSIPKEEYESMLGDANRYRRTRKSALRAAWKELGTMELGRQQEEGTETASSTGDEKKISNGNVHADEDLVTSVVQDGAKSKIEAKDDSEEEDNSRTCTTPDTKNANKDITITTDNKNNNNFNINNTHDKEDESKVKTDLILENDSTAHLAAPSTRDHQALKALREAVDQLPDTKAFRQWYRLDENAIPAVYKLQNISTVYRDITRNDATKRQAAKLSFASIEAKLLKIVKKFAPAVSKDTNASRTYTCSTLDKEINLILEHPMAVNHSVCVVRTIDQLMDRLDEPAVGDYCDLVSESAQAVDADNWKMIEDIRHGLLNGKVSDRNVSSFLVEWTNGGIRPGSNRAQYLYMERMCKALFDQIVGHRDVECWEKGCSLWREELFMEVAEHVQRCHELAKSFQGREDILIEIKSYLKSDTRRPLIVHGAGGCGKSSLLAKTAFEIKHWFQGEAPAPRVLIRMVGCTASSTNVRSLLRDVSLQLCHVFDNNPAGVPLDYKGIFNDLACRLEQATEDTPLVIILEGVDRLSDDNDGRHLLWLPLELPANVRLIVTTDSDDKLHCLPAARNLFKHREESFLEVGPLRLHEAVAILHSGMADKRRLTEQQFEICVQAFKANSLPLFVKMATAEAVRWTSYLASDQIRLGETVTKLIALRLGRLEMEHGEPLTRRALGYISASRHGMTISEIEDVLSLDDAVMDDLTSLYKLPKRRLPALLWLRLQEDLAGFLTECLAGNMRTITWANSQVSDVVDERYLRQRDKAPSYHKALAEYFSRTSIGKLKGHVSNDKSADRLVSNQDLYTEPDSSNGDGLYRVYNLRALSELPFHLMKCQMTKQLKHLCLCNYEWMLARLCGTSLESLLEEYQTILLTEPADAELRVLLEVLLLSRDALERDPRQLASQLLGRLHRLVAADDPKAPGDPQKYPHLHVLLAAAKQSSITVLIPSVECLTQPGKLLPDLLSGHTEPVTAVALTSDGARALSTSRDRTLKVWDIRTGKVIKSIYGVGLDVTDIKTAKSNTLAITVEGSNIKFWDIAASQCMFVVSQYVDPANIAIADDGKILVAAYHGCNIFRSWNIETFSLLCETHIPDQSVHKDNSILIAAASSGLNVLVAFRSGSCATVQHAVSGKMLKRLQCREKNASIVGLAVSSEYLIVCCRQHHVALHEIHALELFDVVKGVYIRTVLGCAQDNIRQISVNLSGSHAIAVSTNARTNLSDVAVFNLETEEHKHMASHCGISAMCECLDFRYCLTGSGEGKSFKVWNLSSGINQPVRKVKQQLGLSDIWPMVDNPRYVLAKAVNNGPISVWNVTKGKCLQSAVRIERGLTEGFDALVVRNTRLVILTDRGLSNVSDDPVLVFQTVLVYDLKLKKYIRKLQGCYIVPAASHEYSLLDNDSLMGPSDNRSHFIIWDLVTGHAVRRLKTAFKELEKRLEHSLQVKPVEGTVGKRDAVLVNASWENRAASRRPGRRAQQDKKAEVDRRRLELLRAERDNVVDQFLVSVDQKVLVASFYGHHLCVFDIPSHSHTHTLQAEHSMMFLHTSALTFDGSHLVHANYDELSKTSYVTLWDCKTGGIQRRLRNEKDVVALAITDDWKRVVIGCGSNELHIWDSMRSNSLRRIPGYDGFSLGITSQITLVENGEKAIVFSGDVSVWDLTTRSVLAVFTPDASISVFRVVLNGRLILFGMHDKPELVVLKLTSGKMRQVEDTGGVELFGETTGDTSDEEDEENQDNDV